ncbi:lipid A biosynthesis acyltransferase [Terrimonas sp.]|uniref:lysophospholipid acyltransferase family protein n=1 Tax=Terrimonas sp. TaxID=1914338 RepID=UPI000D5226A0|nr:lysophospholipid acyltransferase family protein [Terrimonas sp.]PVD51376.1 lipid A biosynthesis acyltransferase [Terrimonas sp.]
MYYIVLALLYLFSFLPLWIIYRVSDFFSFILHYIIGYRKELLMKNLTIAFPEKTEKEKKRIIKKFYRNFTDTFLEAIKLLSMSQKSLEKRIQFDHSIFDELYASGKSCQVHLGHNFNWEWVNVRVTRQLAYEFLVVYMPIGNTVIDRLFKHFREKMGSKMLAATDMKNAMLPYRNSQYLLALVADQNPGIPQKAYWVNFFGRPTPFVKGPEKNARFNNIPVVFARFYKPKRGHYVIETKLAALKPAEMNDGQLTLEYVRYLEEVIRKQPEVYLWSHNRWKFEYKEEYAHLKVEDQTGTTINP